MSGLTQVLRPGLLILLLAGSAAQAAWRVETVAGSGDPGMWQGGYAGDNGPATAARLNNPQGVAVDQDGNMYIADTWNHRIRRVSPDGLIATVAGTGSPGYAGDCQVAASPGPKVDGTPALDCPAGPAQLSYPHAVAVDGKGGLYIADTGNLRVRHLTRNGSIYTLAGNGQSGYSGDNGPAASARLSGPAGLALDRAGNLYITDKNNNNVRRVSADSGTITTVAGKTELWEGFSGDGGLAVLAQLYYPGPLAFDRLGNLLIADMGNNRIRQVSPDGVIKTVAGSERSGIFQGGYWGDGGAATAAGLDLPEGVAVDRAGNLYLADSNNHVIRQVDQYGTIRAIAGDGQYGLADGESARFFQPVGMALDKAGNLYVADRFNHRIRKLIPPADRACEGRATYYLANGAVHLPVVDAILPAGLLRLKVWLQQAASGDFRFLIKTLDSATGQPEANEPPCHAVYAQTDRTLHVPYVDLRPLDDYGNPGTPPTFQVDLQWQESGEFTLSGAQRLR